jgi:hypothetical protein
MNTHVGGVVFYAFHVVSKEIKLLFLPRNDFISSIASSWALEPIYDRFPADTGG